tara:strand:+ start:51 stop:653 length:603 start_codon:yes stop_codon:yes gene_type:complete
VNTEIRSKWWDDESPIQSIWDRLWDKFVPQHGTPIDPSGKVLVYASQIMYDLYNNGGCNLKDGYEEEIEGLESEGISMDWLLEAIGETDDGYLDSTFIDTCGPQVDRMMDNALATSQSQETEQSSKVISELKYLSKRVQYDVDRLVKHLWWEREGITLDVVDEKNKRWVAERLDLLIDEIKSTLKNAGLDSETFNKGGEA